VLPPIVELLVYYLLVIKEISNQSIHLYLCMHVYQSIQSNPIQATHFHLLVSSLYKLSFFVSLVV